ncbi:MAG: RCC1 domain-containing protein [Microthrixaceae bacterium]
MKKLLFAVVPLLMVASACQVGVSMWTSCSPAADGNPFGTDGEYVLACQGGEWVPIMTIGEYLRIRGGMPTIIGSLPEQPSRIAGGDAHSCARATGSGRVECWGANDEGQLGNGTEDDSSRPVAVSGLTTATSLALGYSHSCALLADTTVRC